MDRMALVVGVNYYSDKRIPNLSGCVNDAEEVARLLKRNGIPLGAETLTARSCMQPAQTMS